MYRYVPDLTRLAQPGTGSEKNNSFIALYVGIVWIGQHQLGA
jgi:hypothetical protein